tara:strand:- start:388 stop:534 length:147 start_codon:yes stop_codon:yes gene_type:complete
MKNNNPSTQSLLALIEKKILEGDYNDSVHKIKLMTARDVIKKILQTDF